MVFSNNDPRVNGILSENWLYAILVGLQFIQYTSTLIRQLKKQVLTFRHFLLLYVSAWRVLLPPDSQKHILTRRHSDIITINKMAFFHKVATNPRRYMYRCTCTLTYTYSSTPKIHEYIVNNIFFYVKLKKMTRNKLPNTFALKNNATFQLLFFTLIFLISFPFVTIRTRRVANYECPFAQPARQKHSPTAHVRN